MKLYKPIGLVCLIFLLTVLTSVIVLGATLPIPTYYSPFDTATFNELTRNISGDGSSDEFLNVVFGTDGKVGNGSAEFTNGKINTEAVFSGLVTDDTTYSISMWINVDSVGNNVFYGCAGATYCPSVEHRFGNLRFLSNAGTYVMNTAYTLTTDWEHHVSVVNGTSFTHYVNGNVFFTTTNSNMALTSESLLTIGSNPRAYGTTLYYTGLIDEFTIFDEVLNESQIISLYNNGDGVSLSPLPKSYTKEFITSHWRFNGDAIDFYGRNNWTENGGITYVNNTLFLESGVSSYLRLPSSINMNYGTSENDFTFSYHWWNTPSNTNPMIQANLRSAIGEWSLKSGSNQKLEINQYDTAYGGIKSGINSIASYNNKWSFYVLTYSHAKQRWDIYVDGEHITSDAIHNKRNTPLTDTTNAWEIGRTGTTNNLANTWMDNLTFYTTYFTHEEVNELYAMGGIPYLYDEFVVFVKNNNTNATLQEFSVTVGNVTTYITDGVYASGLFDGSTITFSVNASYYITQENITVDTSMISEYTVSLVPQPPDQPTQNVTDWFDGFDFDKARVGLASCPLNNGETDASFYKFGLIATIVLMLLAVMVNHSIIGLLASLWTLYMGFISYACDIWLSFILIFLGMVFLYYSATKLNINGDDEYHV
jgi:hypothetical protein